ncbi:MAG: hypothetical protein RIE73_05445 [Coleofasciculus sp. C1-SOL-03]
MSRHYIKLDQAYSIKGFQPVLTGFSFQPELEFLADWLAGYSQ